MPRLPAWADVLRRRVDDAYGAGRAGGRRRTPATPSDALLARSGRDHRVPAARAHRRRDRRRRRQATPAGSSSASARGTASGRTSRSSARSATCWRRRGRAASTTRSPDGAVLRWIPLVEGRCADCDDNALEPTVKGRAFPTGQAHPPAHPGCRCLLAPAVSQLSRSERVSEPHPVTHRLRRSIRPMRVPPCRRAAAPARPSRLADRRRGRPRHCCS